MTKIREKGKPTMNHNVFIEALLVAMEFFIYNYVIRKFLKLPFKPQSVDYIFFTLSVFTISFIPNKYSYITALMAILLWTTYVYFLSKKKSVFESLLLYIIKYIYILIIQIFCMLIISFMPLDTTSQYIGFLGNTMTFIFIFITMQIPGVSDIYSRALMSAMPLKLLIINTYIISVIISLSAKIHTLAFYKNIYSFTLTVSILVVFNLCILYYEQKMHYQKAEIDAYKKNLPIYQSLIDEIRSNQHEYSNRLQSLQCLPQTCSTYEQLTEALHTYADTYSKPANAYPLLQLNMPLFAASLYNLTTKAEANGIIINYNIATTTIKTSIPENHLSDFASILLQNAIDESKAGEHIYVSIYNENDKTVIEVRNKVEKHYSPTEIATFFKASYSTKHDKKKDDGTSHGMGLYYLHTQLTKLKGRVIADCISFNNEYWLSISITD